MATVITQTTYRGINNKTENRNLNNGDSDMRREREKEQNHQIVQNALEYANDAQIFIAKGTHEQICERLGNYDIITATRHCAKNGEM